MKSVAKKPARLDDRKTGKSVIVAFGLILAALLFDLAVISTLKSRHRPLHDASLLSLMATLLVGAPLLIALHELGHFIGGRMVGFQLELFVVGPLKVERDTEDRLRWKLNTEPNMMGGVCAMVPTDTDRLLPRFRTVLIAGPLASALGGILFLGLTAVCKATWSAAVLPCEMCTIISFGLAFVTMVPMQNGPFKTDGRRFLELRAGGEQASRDESILSVMALQRSGVPARDWPEDLFSGLEALQDGSIFEGAMHYHAYLRDVDRQEMEAAAFHLDKAYNLYLLHGPAFARQISAEAAWFRAMYPNESQGLFEGLGDDWNSPEAAAATRTMAEAAIAIRQADFPVAQEKLASTWSHVPDLPRNQWVRARLREMESMLQPLQRAAV